MIIRIPIIPTCNDDEENLQGTARFLAALNINMRVHLLPYNSFGTYKHRLLERRYVLDNVKPPSDERIREIKALFVRRGMEVEIGR